MTIDQFILIIALILLFALIFGSVYFLPIVFVKLRSKKLGLTIANKQAIMLAKNKCLTKDFLIAVKEIWEFYPIELNILVTQYFAGGDLQTLKIGVSEMIKRKKEPNINMLTALNLAKRNLKLEVEKAEKNNWNFEF